MEKIFLDLATNPTLISIITVYVDIISLDKNIANLAATFRNIILVEYKSSAMQSSK